MRNISILLVLLLVVNISSAQTFRKIDEVSIAFYYDYVFFNERGNPATEKYQQMVLEVGKSFSKFHSVNKAFADSLIALHSHEPPNVAFSKIMPQLSALPVPILLNYTVIKEYSLPNKLVFFGKTMGESTLLKVDEVIDFTWRVDPERDTTILDDLYCIMATTSYAGRDYVAWFAPEIPINDGPYKFSGLPGLIVKLYDTKNEHVFTLSGIAKPERKAIAIPTEKAVSVNSKGFSRAFEASKSVLIDELDSGNFSNEEMKIKAIGKVINLNNLIEQY